jgi:hypothetical protein
MGCNQYRESNEQLDFPVGSAHNKKGWKGDIVNEIFKHFRVYILEASDLITSESEEEIDATTTCND